MYARYVFRGYSTPCSRHRIERFYVYSFFALTSALTSLSKRHVIDNVTFVSRDVNSSTDLPQS